jgi:hypothetical protein
MLYQLVNGTSFQLATVMPKGLRFLSRSIANALPSSEPRSQRESEIRAELSAHYLAQALKTFSTAVANIDGIGVIVPIRDDSVTKQILPGVSVSPKPLKDFYLEALASIEKDA